MGLLNSLTASDLNDAIPTLWDKKIRIDAARKSFWAKFTGKEGSDQPIIERRDFEAEPGDTVKINVASQLIGEGVTGDTQLEDSEEKFSLGQFTVSPDVLRNAVATNWKAKKQINFNNLKMIGDLLSTWMARRTDEDLFNEIINTNAPAVLYAGAATSRATLGPACTFGAEEISRGKAALRRQGALPIRTMVDGKQEIDWFGVVISEIDEYNLKLDSIWNTAHKDAGVRGDENKIFTGAIGHYDGVYVYTHSAVRFSGRYGSYLRPEAAVTDDPLSDAAVTINVGTNNGVKYTKFFPASGTLLIGDEQITYAAKTNYSFTGCVRAVNGTIAAAHAAGSLVTAKNLGRALFFGAEIGVRAWGMEPTRITDVRDYGYEQGIGIMAYFGQRTVENSDGDKPNMLLMETYSPNPNAAI